jgi:hypothetical protein
MSSAMEIAMKDLSELIAAAASPQSAIDALKAETVTGTYNALRHGLSGDGVVDDYAALSSLLSIIGANQATIIFPAATYRLSTSITIPTNVTVWMLDGAVLSLDTGVELTIQGYIQASPTQIFDGVGLVREITRNPHIYVEWWGAVGDGIADDSPAFTRMLSARAKKIVLLPKTYYLATKVTLSFWTKYITGAGRNVTFIKYGGTHAFEISDGMNYFYIGNMTISDTAGTGTAIYLNNGDNGILENMFIDSPSVGIEMTNCQSVTINDVDVWYFSQFGIYLQFNNNDCVIKNLFLNGEVKGGGGTRGTGTGIRIYNRNQAMNFSEIEIILCNRAMTTEADSNTHLQRFAFSKFDRCYFDSSNFGASVNKCANIQFSQCWFTSVTDNGCTVTNAEGITFNDCTFHGCAIHGCTVSSISHHVVFKGCTAVNNSTVNDFGHGIYIGPGIMDFQVVNCMLYVAYGQTVRQNYGCFLDTGASDRYIIADNLVTANKTGGVRDGGSGANKRVANNY